MFKISRKIEYALMALAKLHSERAQGPRSARELADECHLPYDTVAKILKSLGQHHWVASTAGAKGGYVLQVNLGQVNYLDLAEVLEEKIDGLVCHEEGRCELEGHCQIRAPLKTIDHLIHKFLKQLPLITIISGQGLPSTLEEISL